MTKDSIESMIGLLPLVDNLKDKEIQYKIYSNMIERIKEYENSCIQRQIQSKEDRTKERT